MKALLKKLILSTSLLGLLASPALAECPRGDLDKRYCDVNGDLIADTPTDPSKLVDPDTLIFAYTPVEDPAVYRGVWADFLDHMEKVTGKKVVFFPFVIPDLIRDTAKLRHRFLNTILTN